MKETNIIRYACDRCGLTQILSSSDKARQWHDIRRLDESDQDVSKLLCDTCHGHYLRLIARKHILEFQQFMADPTAGKE